MNVFDRIRDRRAFAPPDDPAPGGAGDPPPDAAAAAAAAAAAVAANPPAPVAKWFEAKDYSAEEQQWLAARGLADDDPLAAIPKLVKGHRAAEQRIGKGLDSILDKPAKDQPYTDWVAANREALGLPKDEAAYEIAKPEGWPKDAQWDTTREGQAKAIALRYGVPKEALQELVALQAGGVMEMMGASAADLEKARGALMTELETQYGTQTPAVIQKARQGAEAVATKAGLSTEALANLSDTLTDKIGDANAIRFMAAIRDMMGDDSAVGLGRGGALTTTPAEARADLARQMSPEGDWYKATASNNRAEIERLKPTIDRLNRIAAGS